MFDWAISITNNVQTQLQAGNLPHALLLTGPEGQGKKSYSKLLTQQMLCDQHNACGQCKSCLLELEFHPDVFLVQPQLPSKMIRVDQIRQLLSFMTLAPHTASCKVAVLEDCDRMNRESANALLKILEEPPQNRYLLLTSSHAGNLLPTIKSRVNEIAFPSPDITQTTQQMEKLLRQNEVVATEERITKALQKHPHAPMLAYDYCLQKGDEVEQTLIQWLYDVWVLSKATIFPELPQLQAAIGDRVSLQQTKLKTIQLLISELILQQHQTTPDVAPSSQGSMNKMKQKILADMPSGSLLQVYQRLIELAPQLQQINAQSKINAIIHQYNKPI